jgi:hypothetical protein
MIWKNKNFRHVFIACIVILIVVFIVPVISPVDAQWYYQNLNWLIPLVIVLFIVPMVPFFLSGWDIHFHFEVYSKKLSVSLTNAGATPFSFSRVQFASRRKYWVFGKRELYPEQGMYGGGVFFKGADEFYQQLTDHGCILKKGMPMILTVLDPKAPEYLATLERGWGKVYMCLYYQETEQRVYSQPIPLEHIRSIIEPSSQD